MLETALIIIPMAFMLSLGHCLGMCGGFVVAYSSKLSKKSKFQTLFYSLSYQVSRVFAYVVLGALAGYFGSFFSINREIQGFFHFVLGIFFVIFGVALHMRGKILALIESDKIWKFLFEKPMKFAILHDNYASFLLLGFLNGLMPCGVVYTFLGYAISSESALNGAFVMFIFGISTLPTLVSFSFVTNLLNAKFKNIMLLLSIICIIIFGVYNAYLGFIATHE